MKLSAYARKAAKTLFRVNRKNHISWRTIQRQGYRDDDVSIQPGIKPGTLCRFAKAKGAWIPATIELQKALGIYRERKHPAKMIIDMARDELLLALKHRKPFTPTFTQREMKEFIRACKRARPS